MMTRTLPPLHPQGNAGRTTGLRRRLAKNRHTPLQRQFRLVSPRRASNPVPMPLLLAATTLEKIQAVPTKFWLNTAIIILILMVAIIVIRKAAEMNKVVLSAIIFVVFSSVGFQWIYLRNEPKFMTPFIEPLSNFFPTKEKQVEKENRAVVP
jgi:hypothetical protein